MTEPKLPTGDRKTDDDTLIEALQILSSKLVTEDGVISACLANAAARLKTLVEEQAWIPVTERTPELNESNHFRLNCIACCKGGLVYEMVYEINTFAKHERHRQPRWKWHGTISMWEVTHWRALPRGPETQEVAK